MWLLGNMLANTSLFKNRIIFYYIHRKNSIFELSILHNFSHAIITESDIQDHILIINSAGVDSCFISIWGCIVYSFCLLNYCLSHSIFCFRYVCCVVVWLRSILKFLLSFSSKWHIHFFIKIYWTPMTLRNNMCFKRHINMQTKLAPCSLFAVDLLWLNSKCLTIWERDSAINYLTHCSFNYFVPITLLWNMFLAKQDVSH